MDPMMLFNFPGPDFDQMRKSWRRATASQKFTRVGLIGGAVGGLIYLFTTGRSSRPSPELPAEFTAPVPREPPATPVERPVSSGRGTYR